MWENGTGAYLAIALNIVCVVIAVFSVEKTGILWILAPLWRLFAKKKKFARCAVLQLIPNLHCVFSLIFKLVLLYDSSIGEVLFLFELNRYEVHAAI